MALMVNWVNKKTRSAAHLTAWPCAWNNRLRPTQAQAHMKGQATWKNYNAAAHRRKSRPVLAVLVEDPGLVWLVSPQKKRPTDLRDILSRTQGLAAVDLSEDLPIVYIYVASRTTMHLGGSFTAEKLLDHTVLTASVVTAKQQCTRMDG